MCACDIADGVWVLLCSSTTTMQFRFASIAENVRFEVSECALSIRKRTTRMIQSCRFVRTNGRRESWDTFNTIQWLRARATEQIEWHFNSQSSEKFARTLKAVSHSGCECFRWLRHFSGTHLPLEGSDPSRVDSQPHIPASFCCRRQATLLTNVNVHRNRSIQAPLHCQRW